MCQIPSPITVHKSLQKLDFFLRFWMRSSTSSTFMSPPTRAGIGKLDFLQTTSSVTKEISSRIFLENLQLNKSWPTVSSSSLHSKQVAGTCTSHCLKTPKDAIKLNDVETYASNNILYKLE